MFDIGITQALNVATDDETKVRLKAQLAILDNNEAMAKKLLAELEAYEALKKLAESANKLDEAFRNMIRGMLDQIKPTLNELQTLTLGALRSETRTILNYGAPAVKGLQELIAPTQPGTFEDLRGNISGLLEQARPSISGLQQLLAGIQQTSAPTLNQIFSDPRVTKQLQITGEYNYGNIDEKGLADMVYAQRDEKTTGYNDKIAELTLRKTLEKTDEGKKLIQGEIDQLQSKLDGVNSSYDKLAQEAYKNPDYVRGFVYKENSLDNLRGMFGSVKVSKENMESPLWNANFKEWQAGRQSN